MLIKLRNTETWAGPELDDSFKTRERRDGLLAHSY
jgi:hypothetical protein